MSTVVDDIIKAAEELPPFPRVAGKIMALLEDPDVSAAKLGEVVQMDPSLTANVLKAVNSPIYALPRKVDNISQALAYLGNRAFGEVVWTSASAKVLFQAQPGYEMARGDLWRHSLATALMTQVLCVRVGLLPGPALYTSALLHDIGKVVLSSFVQTEFNRIMAEVEKGSALLEAERDVLGMDHAQLGALIAKKWRFSENMVDLIGYHHEPERQADSLELGILYLANLACQMLGLGGGAHGLAIRGKAGVMKSLGLKERDLEMALAELYHRLGEAEAMLTMV